jgi:hypothetical protein
MGNVGDDTHKTYIIYTVEVPVEQVEDVDAGVQITVEGVDFLVVGPCSAVMNVEQLKFLYEGCAVDVEASDGASWCWWVGCNMSWFFCGSSDACSRSMVNGRLWFSKKLLPNVVPHQMYFLYVCMLVG